MDDLDIIYPNRTVKAPYDSSVPGLGQYTRHAEEGVMAEFENAVNNAGIRPEDVKGDLYLMQSNGNGVCNKCTKDLLSPASDGEKGIFKQFTELYPNLNINVSTYSKAVPGSGHGSLSFELQNSVVTNLVKK